MDSKYATKLILQFLDEQGFTESKKCLLNESGMENEHVDFKFGGNLMEMLVELSELKLSMGEEDTKVEIDDLVKLLKICFFFPNQKKKS